MVLGNMAEWDTYASVIETHTRMVTHSRRRTKMKLVTQQRKNYQYLGPAVNFKPSIHIHGAAANVATAKKKKRKKGNVENAKT